MPNKPELVTPGTPHYDDRLADMTQGLDMEAARRDTEWMANYQAGSTVLGFITHPLPAKHALAHVSHAIDRSNADSPKMVFHYNFVSRNEMGTLGEAIYQHVLPTLHALKDNIRVIAGESPLNRIQWDLVIFGVPAMRTTEVHRLVMRVSASALKG